MYTYYYEILSPLVLVDTTEFPPVSNLKEHYFTPFEINKLCKIKYFWVVCWLLSLLTQHHGLRDDCCEHGETNNKE